MSIKLMTRVYEKDLPATDQRVLLVLCDHANDFGTECYPSLAYVAWRLGADRKTVMRSVRRLEASGVLTIDRQHRRNNRYTIDLEILPDKPPFVRSHSGTQTAASHSDPQDPKGPSKVPSSPPLGPFEAHVGSPQEGPQPSENHQIEPPEKPSGTKTAKAHPIPERFTITNDARAWAHDKYPGVPAAWLETQTEAFCDHFRATGGRKVDWIAAWRNWIRRAMDERPPRSPNGHRPANGDAAPDRHQDEDWFGEYANGARRVVRGGA